MDNKYCRFIKEDDEKIPKPLLFFPTCSFTEVRTKIPKRIVAFEFYAVAKGCQRVFDEQDGITDIGKQVIPDPSKVSYMNLFINGVLQPHENYTVEPGKLTLNTIDTPIQGTPIILQMFIV
ncbi:DUF4183 domain-containing protein [Peribacillus muralis]|uniref:DUF4183 domain-containing protein n=1 Tax=Peribacillus muralis TaxID=264697 RepID=UPI0009E8C4C5|nr:DUF4183 domain-containing protein [Peribacillus muralis]